MDKKGQGLSLNVIIVAALALIVLVVLVVVFTGRIGIFEEGVSKESQAELVKLKISYGDCRPTATVESGFITAYNQAETTAIKEEAVADFKDIINECKALSDDRSICEAADCKWK